MKINSRDCISKNKLLITEVAIVVLVFASMLILNLMTGWISDDCHYHFFFDTMGNPGENSRQISSLWDIICSQINHRQLANGRVVAHGLLQIVFQFGSVFFDIFNSSVYAFLGILIYKHAAAEKRNPLLLCGIYLMMWFFIPQFGATCLWASGSANYLWMSALILACLLPYRLYAVNQDSVKDSVKNIILMSVFGLFAGCTNENGGGAFVLSCILFIVFYKLNNIKVPKWAYCCIIAAVAGIFILIQAPGNYRINSSTNLDGYIVRFKEIWSITKTQMMGLFIILAVVLFFFERQNGKTTFRNSHEIFSLIYIIPCFASIFVMIFSAMHPERTWFIGIIMFICAIAYMYNKLELHAFGRYIPVLVAVIAFAFSYSAAVKSNAATWEFVSQGIQIIEQAKETGERNVTIPFNSQFTKNSHNSFTYAIYLGENPADWANQWMAKYYEIDTITGYKINVKE